MWSKVRIGALLSLLCAGAAAAQEIRPTFTPVSGILPVAFEGMVESPNGRYLLVSTDSAYTRYEVLRFDRTTKEWIRVPELDRVVGPMALSRDGRFLAYARKWEDQSDWRIWITPVDPATLLPSGPARRVSTRPGGRPSFSPDGRTLAFLSWDSVLTRLVTVPFNGGEERVMLESPQYLGPPHWSADGRYLYCDYSPDPARVMVIRVSVLGGRVDSLRPRVGLIGLSSDGRRLAQAPPALAPLVIIADADGRELGWFALPRDFRLYGFGWSPSNPNRMLGSQLIVPDVIRAVSLADGSAREITSGRTFDHSPKWSPDGRLVAFVTLVGSKNQLAIADPNGGARRLIAGDADAGEALAWSPDGRYIAVASINPLALNLIEVASGQQRRLALTGERGWTSSFFIWRSDSRSLVYLRNPAVGRAEAREVTLDGRDHLLRAMEFARVNPARARGVAFASESLLVVSGTDSIVGIPLPSGPVRTLYRGAIRNNAVGISPDRKWIGFLSQERGRQAPQIIPRILSLETGETRSVAYGMDWGLWSVLFHPDGRHLILLGQPTVNARPEIVLVALNGDAPRVLTANDRTSVDINTVSISPDGRTVIYDGERAWESQLVEVELPSAPAPVVSRASASRRGPR